MTDFNLILTEYLINIGPAITAIITTIVSLCVSVHKVKCIRRDTMQDVAATNNELIERQKRLEASLEMTLKENASLKRELTRILSKIYHVHTTEDCNNEIE